MSQSQLCFTEYGDPLGSVSCMNAVKNFEEATGDGEGEGLARYFVTLLMHLTPMQARIYVAQTAQTIHLSNRFF